MSEIILRGPVQMAYLLKLLGGLDLSKPWQITVARYRKKRSLSQNALLHKWFTEIANEVGDNMESVKSDLKRMFLPMVERTSRLTGEVTVEPKHTSDLNTLEMTEFMDKVMAFAGSQLGILLTLPEEQHTAGRAA